MFQLFNCFFLGLFFEFNGSLLLKHVVFLYRLILILLHLLLFQQVILVISFRHVFIELFFQLFFDGVLLFFNLFSLLNLSTHLLILSKIDGD